MNLKTPITVEAQVYDKYHFTMVTQGQLFEDDTKYQQVISLELVPMGRDEDNKIILNKENKKVFRTFDITTKSLKLQKAFYDIEQIIQTLINEDEI